MYIFLFWCRLFAVFLMCIAPMGYGATELFATETKHCRASIRHIEGGGIGYNKGYTTLEAFFAPDPVSLDWVPFLDVRGHIFDDARGAANAGVGLRKIVNDRVYGFNAYYDYRTAKKIRYNQVGFGLESLGKFWDLRLNGYLPLGKTITPVSELAFVGFAGHQMKTKQYFRFAMNGAQAELGFHLGNHRLFDFYTAFGPYFFMGKVGHKVWGGKARIAAQYKEYVKIELSDSYDRTFHNRFQCQLTLTMPFGKGSHATQSEDWRSCTMSEMLVSKIIQPVERQEIIVSDCEKKCSIACDPTTRKPCNFVFVDNTSHSLGTFESPYPTLALAQENSAPGDIIYVFPGDGTTKGMDEGITLQLNQKFWGSGTNHPLQTAQGSLVIPAQSSSAPKITNVAGSGVTLSRSNQVSGFTITSAFDNGIFGIGIDNVDISDCAIDASLLSDLVHLEYGGNAGFAALNRLTLTNGASNALFINAPASAVACTVNDCIFKNNSVYTINASFAQNASLNVTGNLFENNVNGTNFNFSGAATLLVSGNRFNGTTSVSSKPLFIQAGTSPLNATIRGNTITNNITGGVHFVLNNTDGAKLIIQNNTISNNGTGSAGPFGAPLFIDTNNTNLGNCSLDLSRNTLLNNTGVGLYCANGNFNTYRVNATNNNMNGNGGGLSFANPTNSFALNASNNIITNARDHGITTVGVIMNQANIAISNNQITNNINQASGIALSHDSTTLNLVVTDNDINNNQGSGIIMYSSLPIQDAAVKIANNTIINNQNLGSNQTGGIDVEQYATLSASITNNTLANDTGPGVYIGSTDTSPAVCLTLSGNVSDTGYTLDSGSGTFNLAPCNVETVNSGAITQVGTITLVQSCPGAVACAP